MEYTNKQIKRLLRIQELVEISNSLYRTYRDFDNKELCFETLNDKSKIYLVYCSSLYNSIKSIQDTNDLFEKSEKFNTLQELIRQNVIAENNQYCSEQYHKTTVFKIIETIRNQVNHSKSDDNDNNILFSIYINDEILDKIRNVINELFYEAFDSIEKGRIKRIEFSIPKVKYSLDLIDRKSLALNAEINNSRNRLNGVFKKENNKALMLFNQIFNSNTLYDIYSGNPEAIDKFEKAKNELNESLKKVEVYIMNCGNELEKEALIIFNEFLNNRDAKSINELKKYIEMTTEKLQKLKGNDS